MTAYEFLHRVLGTKEELEAVQAAVAEAEAMATSMTPKLSGMPSTGSGEARKVESAAIAAAEFLTELTEYKEKLVRQRAQAFKAIMKLKKQTWRAVLIERYINGLRFEDIAAKMNYEPSGIYRIHRIALKEIVVPKDVK